MKNTYDNWRAWCCVIVLMALVAACGSDISGGNDVLASIAADSEVLMLDDRVVVEFPAGSVSQDVAMSIEEIDDVDGYYAERFDVNSVLYEADHTHSTLVRVQLSEQPTSDVTVRYQVSDEFLQSIGDDYHPRLFGLVFEGHDNEVLDLFSPVGFQLEGNMLVSTVAPWFFTDERHGTPGEFEAILLLSSVPKENVVPSRITSSSSKVQNAIPAPVCLGATIGSPLKRDLVVTSGFGDRLLDRKWKFHRGVDYRANRDEVIAVADGVVERVKLDAHGYGWYIVLIHLDGSASIYAHLTSNSWGNLRKNDRVQKGQVLALSGNTGRSDGAHLHFEYSPTGKLFNKDDVIDPRPCINPVIEEFDSQITIRDNGATADDAFALAVDGKEIGRTEKGEANTFAVNNLRPGEHTVTVTAVDAEDDLGTARIGFSVGAQLLDGRVGVSVTLREGQSADYTIVVEGAQAVEEDPFADEER